MNRDEQINKAASDAWNEHGATNQEQKIAYELGFLEGAMWADFTPRTDIIGRDSVSFCRALLIGKFCNIAKNNPDKTLDEVPEMKEAFDMADMFDKACESVGYKFNEDRGIYERHD